MKRRTAWKIAGGVVGLAVLIAALGYGALQLMMAHFYPDPPAKAYPKPANALEAQRQDLDYLTRVLALDRSFSDSARAQANARIAALEKSSTVLSRPQFLVALMRIEALADNGHTKARFNDDSMPTELPVRVSQFSDGIYVMRAKGDGVPLLGGRVTAVDGQPVDTVLKKLDALKGGAANFRRYYATVYILMPQVLYALGIAKDADHSVWTVQSPDGRTVTQRLTAYAPKNEPYVFPERWYSSEPLKGMGAGWQYYQPKALAASLRNFDQVFQRRWLPDSCVLAIQFKSNTDVDNQKIADFTDATDKAMAARKPCNIILDQRYNGGGDYTLTHDFSEHLADALPPGGHIYLLTSVATFSAAITNVAFVKDAGGNRVTILGEPVGDRLDFFAEGGRACMPNSDLCMGYETGEHNYGGACTDLNKCFWVNWFYPVRVKTLQPDETIHTSFADWSAGRDPVFDRAVQLAARNAN